MDLVLFPIAVELLHEVNPTAEGGPYRVIEKLEKAVNRKEVDPANVYIIYNHADGENSYMLWENIVADGCKYMLDQYVAMTDKHKMEPIKRYAFERLVEQLANKKRIEELAPTPIKTAPQRLAEETRLAEEAKNAYNEDMDPDLQETQETVVRPIFDDDLDPDQIEDNNCDSEDDY
jgi:hypothetical protein